MDTKTSDWRPGPSVCRCCLTEGCYKDISTEYFWMGKKEVYSEMLSDTFSISIAYSQSGGPNSNSRLICEPCIARLRDASDFRRQVVECEKTFMQHLDPGTSSSLVIETHPENMECEVKLERVKLEKRLSDDELDDPDFLDDDDDDMDDEPLTKLASKVPKKESVDLLDLLDNSKSALKRKSTTKTKASPAKKSKTKKEPAKAASSKATKPEKKKKEQNPVTIARRNAQTIIKYTTGYPFRFPQSTIVCVYCGEKFDDPMLFRNHMNSQHEDVNIKLAFAHFHEGYIKVDCTDLRCRICLNSFESLGEIAHHLKYAHKLNIDINHSLFIHPFRFGKDKLLCGVCNAKCINLRSQSRHIISHFLKFNCKLCKKAYVTSSSLKYHLRYTCSVAQNPNKCDKCKKVLNSYKELTEHLKMSVSCCKHICKVCGGRFSTWKLKRAHMETTHGIPKKEYPCLECNRVFRVPELLKKHFDTSHTGEHFECMTCGEKFDSGHGLNSHFATCRVGIETGDIQGKSLLELLLTGTPERCGYKPPIKDPLEG